VTKSEFVAGNRDRLLLDRAIVIEEPITSAVADRVVGRMLDLEASSRADIYLFLDSPGGDLKAALAVYETMRFTTCSVVTIGMGQAASSAALLLAAGSAGLRVALSGARIMLHKPRADRGPRVEREDAQMQRVSTLIFKILSAHIARPFEAIEVVAREERTFTATEAQAFGIVDAVDLIPDRPWSLRAG